MKKISFTLMALTCLFSAFSQNRATFESLPLATNSYWDGSDLSGGFVNGDAHFSNTFDTSFGGYWSGGFIYSNVKNDTTAGFANEYAAYPTSGVFGSDKYTVCYVGGTSTIALQGFATGHPVYGFYVTNSTYAYLSMKNGDQFAKKFGGPTGTDPDWFKLTVRGWYNGTQIANSVDFYLADFRSSDSTQDYILDSWKFVDLQSLGNVDSLFFDLNSSDVGGFGMNTPAYFALDNFMTTDGATIISPPVAVLDTVSTLYTDSVTIHILANDTLSTFLGHTVNIISGPQVTGAVAYLDQFNYLVYVPQVGIRTVDTLVYSYCDEFNNCTTAQVVINVEGLVNTGISEASTATLQLYPNPAQSLITVSSESVIGSISITDISGREVKNISVGQHTSTIDISSLSAGIYTVLTHTSDGAIARRLVKE
ncbi:MAG: hypothetical protein JWO03_2744 [Bacteroidetes bacterium]|nr:hypothetical protein [Bacteroidota bacterium]